MGQPPVLVLDDVTSSYFEGEQNELAEYGYHRDGKKGKKQIVIGLLTADDGEPLAVKVFKGKDGSLVTVADQIEIVKRRFQIEEVVFVGDRGMVKAKGKAALTDQRLKYITALTAPQVRKLLKKDVIQIDRFEEIALKKWNMAISDSSCGAMRPCAEKRPTAAAINWPSCTSWSQRATSASRVRPEPTRRPACASERVGQTPPDPPLLSPSRWRTGSSTWGWMRKNRRTRRCWMAAM